MKKVLFLFALIALVQVARAQQTNALAKGFHLGAGINAGLPVGDFNETHSFGIGAEIQGEYVLLDKLSIFGSTGYTNFFGKKFDTEEGEYFKVDNVGAIPVLAGARFYPTPKFFVGGKLGISILTGGGESETAFTYQPQVGYNAEKFQANLGLNSMSSDGLTFSNLSLTFLYKLK